MTGQNRTVEDRIGEESTVEVKGQDRARQYRRRQNCRGDNRTVEERAGQNRTVDRRGEERTVEVRDGRDRTRQ